LRPPASPSPLQEVQALVERMQAGEVDALFVLGANPVYELPAALGFAEALKNVSLVATFATLPTETTALSDIVLPAHTYLETWGYQLLQPGAAQLVVSAQQPVVRPQLDSRDPADVLLALADKLGGKAAKRLPWPNLVTFIQTRLTSLQLLEGNIASTDTATFWASWLQHGGWWSQETLWQPSQPVATSEALTVSPPQFEGDESGYPFHLLPVSTINLADGRHAALPWLQETPDPMTTASWDTWVELNPETARKLGIQANDVVKVSSPAGEIEAIAYLYPGIRPDVVAMPLGQGHTELGRWAAGRGANPWAILSPRLSDETGELAWAATRVNLVPTGRKRVLPALESNIGVDRARQKGEVPG
ncbi:MAG: 4Fe-4S ferredoxin, partial [Caldilineae bacterium]